MSNITLTGADQRTKFGDLERLADMGAEIGFLYTFDPEGRNRYPPLSWILEACHALGKRRVAIHICGGRARMLLMQWQLPYLFDLAYRVQINGEIASDVLMNVCDRYQENEIITQHVGKNKILIGLELDNHQVLVDASGGQGKLPEKWERPSDTIKPVGFAGGLGPETLREQLPLIAQVAVEPWWIDMEGKLRDKDDWFDVEKALAVMEIWREWVIS